MEACVVQMGFVGDKMGQDFLLVLRNFLPIFIPQMPIHIYQEGQNIRSIRGCSIKELGVTRFLKIKNISLQVEPEYSATLVPQLTGYCITSVHFLFLEFVFLITVLT